MVGLAEICGDCRPSKDHNWPNNNLIKGTLRLAWYRRPRVFYFIFSWQQRLSGGRCLSLPRLSSSRLSRNAQCTGPGMHSQSSLRFLNVASAVSFQVVPRSQPEIVPIWLRNHWRRIFYAGFKFQFDNTTVCYFIVFYTINADITINSKVYIFYVRRSLLLRRWEIFGYRILDSDTLALSYILYLLYHRVSQDHFKWSQPFHKHTQAIATAILRLFRIYRRYRLSFYFKPEVKWVRLTI